MVDYIGEVRNKSNSRSTIFGVNLVTVPELKLNCESIYESELCAVLTEVNPTLNLGSFPISLNDQLNLRSFVISIVYLSTRELKGISFEKFASKWIINLDTSKPTLYAMMQLVISSSENTSLHLRFNKNNSMIQYNFVTSDVFINTSFSYHESRSKHQFNYY